MKPQPNRFADPGLRIGDRPDFPRQSDFAEGHHVVAERLILQTGNQRQRHRQIGGGFIQPQSADNVDIGVQIGEKISAPLFQHRQKQGKAIIVKAVAIRRGFPKLVGETSPCTSANKGRVPSIIQATQVPLTLVGLPSSSILEAFSTSARP